MLKVSCSACGQTFFGRPAEEGSPQDCELCGAIGTVTPIRSEADAAPAKVGDAAAAPAKTVRGSSGAAMPFGAALLFLGVLIWMLSGENQGSTSGNTLRMDTVQTPRQEISARPKEPSKQSRAGQTSPASQPASSPSESAVFLVPETIPNHWRDTVAKAKGAIPPFDDQGHFLTSAGDSAGFIRMVQDYMHLPEDEQIGYLQWVATTHASDDLRIWACSMLGDMGHTDELRGVRQHQDSERARTFIENFLTRKRMKRTVIKTQGGKK